MRRIEMIESEVKRFDPIKDGFFSRGTPHDFKERKIVDCKNCAKPTPHDYYVAILGLSAGFMLPFGKKSTMGKVGKRSNWAFCAVCGAITPLDEAAQYEVMKALERERS